MNELESAGYSPSKTKSPSRNPIVLYFSTLRSILTGPSEFFRNLKHPTGFTGPLLFGIITNWIGSALEYLWYTGFGRVFGNRLSDIFSALDKSSEIDSSGQAGALLAMRTRILEWVFGMSSVLIDPFKTSIKILFISFFIWVGARLFAKLGPDSAERLNYDSAVAVVGYSLAASIFKGVPVLGGVIAGLFAVIIAINGARETYRVSSGRAVLIALFPTLLFWGLIIGSIIAFFSAIAMLFLR